MNNLFSEDTTQIDIVNKKDKYPIRVLHVVAGLGVGGYETFLFNVFKNIDRSKVQFDFLYSFDGAYKDEILALGGKVFKIPFITQVGPFLYKKNIYEYLKKHKEYKIVHSHMDKFSGQIMKLAKKSGVPVRIAHSHNTMNQGDLLYKIVKNYYGLKIKNNCTDRFACGKEAGEWIFSKDFEFRVVRNGVDTDKFANIDNRNENEFSIINVARFNTEKNHKFLIDVFNEVYKKDNSAKLYLAGIGDTQLEIKQKVEKLGLKDSVVFFDICKDISNLLSKADVLCMPSLFEGLPVSLIEAQSSGTPCVVSNNITEEVNITGDVEFLSLEEPLEKWADALLKHKGKEKKNNKQKIIDIGYDIKTSAKFLEEFYIKKA